MKLYSVQYTEIISMHAVHRLSLVVTTARID